MKPPVIKPQNYCSNKNNLLKVWPIHGFVVPLCPLSRDGSIISNLLTHYQTFMATKIRLQRHGRKGYAFYSIVIADVRAPRDGKFTENVADLL